MVLLSSGLATTCATEGGQTGEEFPAPCLETREPVAPETAPGELGFSGDEVLAELSGSYAAPFAWADGDTTALTLTLGGRDGAVVHVVATRDPDFGGFVECPDALEVPVSLAFVTDDGGFDERVETTLRAFEVSEGNLFWRLEAAGIARVEPLVPADVVSPRLSFGGTVRAGETRGAVSGDDGSRPDTEPFQVGSWGADVLSLQSAEPAGAGNE